MYMLIYTPLNRYGNNKGVRQCACSTYQSWWAWWSEGVLCHVSALPGLFLTSITIITTVSCDTILPTPFPNLEWWEYLCEILRLLVSSPSLRRTIFWILNINNKVSLYDMIINNGALGVLEQFHWFLQSFTITGWNKARYLWSCNIIDLCRS